MYRAAHGSKMVEQSRCIWNHRLATQHGMIRWLAESGSSAAQLQKEDKMGAAYGAAGAASGVGPQEESRAEHTVPEHY